jgi:large conductance mechanosensitive channel
MLKGFRDFIVRGNVVDLAVAVVIGLAFTAVVSAVVKDLLTPLIAAIFGQPNFESLTVEVNHSQFAYGDVINSLISFLLVAAAIYFLIVAPIARIQARGAKPPEVTTRDCPHCLSMIPRAAHRCSYCTQEVTPLA